MVKAKQREGERVCLKKTKFPKPNHDSSITDTVFNLQTIKPNKLLPPCTASKNLKKFALGARKLRRRFACNITQRLNTSRRLQTKYLLTPSVGTLIAKEQSSSQKNEEKYPSGRARKG